MSIHKLLARQLSRQGFDEASLPSNMSEWQNFINTISKTYTDSDDERYLTERSMELSSREILVLNQNLESAQHIAGLGYWTINIETGTMYWSKELRNMFQLPSTSREPSLIEFMEMVHPNDRNLVKTTIEQALSAGKKYSLEVRVKIADGSYRWQHAVATPQHGSVPPFKILAGIVMDITARKNSEQEIYELSQQLLTSAREVGMADVASSILQNIGNVLSNLTVSCNKINESYSNSNYQNFFDVCKQIKEHADNINEYLHIDEKGKTIPKYLVALANPMQEEFALRTREIININAGVKQIHDIVQAQRTIANFTGVHDKIEVTEVIDLTLKMLGSELSKLGIVVVKKYIDAPIIYTDRSKLTQIIFNLIQNAIDALIKDASNDQSKEIHVSIKINESDMVEISVTDNGIGIKPDEIDHLFNFGNVATETSHGLGLHACAICATALGGKITVSSNGIGSGSTFMVEIPAIKQTIE